MNSIKLDQILINHSTVEFDYSISKELKRYFSGKPFIIEYPDSIEEVPKSVLAIPFVCNVLPIIWMTDSILELDEIDKAFYDSIPEFKKGYIQMYPNAEFKGDIKVKKIVENKYPDEKKSAMFYSGGLDSASTLISHLDEKPVLLSIWGSDIKYDNKEGWDLVHSAITEASERFGLEEYVFHSSFREFDNEGELDSEFSKVLGDGWWHGIKHSLALLGHIAPFVFEKKIQKMYIASTLCSDYGFATCASVPQIDNYFKVSSCKVVHDGYELSRQQKANNLVTHLSGTGFKLHVCWANQSGTNCSTCEKCYRTMANLWAEGASIRQFGFDNSKEKLIKMPICISNLPHEARMQMYWWKDIQKRAQSRRDILKSGSEYKYFKWILLADFDHPETIKAPFSYRMRNRLSHLRFYKKLHVVKERIKGKK